MLNSGKKKYSNSRVVRKFFFEQNKKHPQRDSVCLPLFLKFLLFLIYFIFFALYFFSSTPMCTQLRVGV
jgi:hypothetical protein